MDGCIPQTTIWLFISGYSIKEIEVAYINDVGSFKNK